MATYYIWVHIENEFKSKGLIPQVMGTETLYEYGLSKHRLFSEDHNEVLKMLYMLNSHYIPFIFCKEGEHIKSANIYTNQARLRRKRTYIPKYVDDQYRNKAIAYILNAKVRDNALLAQLEDLIES